MASNGCRGYRYKSFWYQSVIDMIKNYEYLKNDGLEGMYKRSIQSAFRYFENKTPYDIKESIYMQYIRNTHTINGVANKMHVHPKTVSYWNRKFVYKVGEGVGLSQK